MLKQFVIFLLLTYSLSLVGQVDSDNSFPVLNVKMLAREVGAGGNALALPSEDLELRVTNPSLLNEEYHDKAIFGYQNYISSINNSYAGYARTFDSIGTFSAFIRYVNYGEFDKVDEFEINQGTFKANDLLFTIGYGTEVYDSVLFFGANLNFINSTYDDLTSFGLSTDLVLTYFDDANGFSSALVLKNIGYQFKSFYPGQRNPLPFQMDIAIYKDLKHAPFRFNLVYENIQEFDLYKEDPNRVVEIDPFTGEEIDNSVNFGNQLLRHFVISTEIKLGKRSYFQLGYNFRRAIELAYDERKGMSGFTFGLGLQIKKIGISYAYANYAKGFLANSVSLKLDFKNFYRKINN